METSHTNGLVILIAFICFSANAQMTPLNNWTFSQTIELDNEIAQDPRLEAVFIEDMLLVTHPNLDGGTGCGEVLLLAENGNGRFEPQQILSAQDFGRDCSSHDGFGFSVGYADGLLVIGAPGQVFIEPEELPSVGAVYIYRLDANGNTTDGMPLIASAYVPGSGENKDLAWGTRVETDGIRILVQGNQGRDPAIPQGRVISKTVNMLENDGNENWNVTRQFSGDASIYGHDFLINGETIFINSHVFDRYKEGSINSPATNFYHTAIEIYGLSSGVGQIELRQTLELSRLTGIFPDQNRNDRLQDTDQLYRQQDKLVVYVTYFAAFDGESEIIWFEPDRDNLFQQIGVLEFLGHNIKITDQLTDIDGVGIFQRDNQGLNRGTITSYASEAGGIRKGVQQIIADKGNQSIQTIVRNGQIGLGIDYFRVSASNNRLLIARNEQNIHQLSIFTAQPALDPAITGLWWFGPQFNGQGITLEVLLGNRLQLHWFTYDLSGKQMWVRGVGRLENGTINIQLVRARGPQFPIGLFNPNDKVVESWGSVEVSFTDCRNGQLSYQSNEFGSDSLPITTLVDNTYECDRGFIIDTESVELSSRFKYPRIVRSNTGGPANNGPSMVGSFFDQSRSGEGFIFMPAKVDNNDIRSRKIVGLWLTYDQQGNQAWYYLGLLSGCGTVYDRCRFEPVGQPRMSSGPIFGPGYNPDDRVTVPWGILGELMRNPDSSLSVDFDNPHGSGSLRLDKHTNPIGY